MNITPIRNLNITPKSVKAISFNSNALNADKNEDKSFYCPKTSVNNTLREFSNSRGQYLADIDLSDIYISNVTNVSFTGKQPQYLADMDLTDAYELPAKKDTRKTNIQFLADMNAIETYETACKTNSKNREISQPINSLSEKQSNKNLLKQLSKFIKNIF